LLKQRADLPTETELWKLIIREQPEWSPLVGYPVQRQLFTRLTTGTE